MSSPIHPAPAKGITRLNEITPALVITSDTATGCRVETAGRTFTDSAPRDSPGSGGLAVNDIAPDASPE